MIADFDDTKLHCKLIDKYISGDETPDDCSLQKVGIFNYEGGLATKQCNSL